MRDTFTATTTVARENNSNRSPARARPYAVAVPATSAAAFFPVHSAGREDLQQAQGVRTAPPAPRADTAVTRAPDPWVVAAHLHHLKAVLLQETRRDGAAEAAPARHPHTPAV
jgi:hypothetical protein